MQNLTNFNSLIFRLYHLNYYKNIFVFQNRLLAILVFKGEILEYKSNSRSVRWDINFFIFHILRCQNNKLKATISKKILLRQMGGQIAMGSRALSGG